jgi:hypothetical protein
MPMLFSRKPFLQDPADLLRAPPLRQALHDVMPQLVVTGNFPGLGLGLLFCAIFWARNG